MAKLDKFIDMMVQRQIERAILIGDKPSYIFIDGQKTEGSVIPAERLRQSLIEVAPKHLHPQIEAGGSFHFRYDSPQGPYDAWCRTSFDAIQITLAPHKPQSITTSIVTPSNSASAQQTQSAPQWSTDVVPTPRPSNYPEAFVWWQQRRHGRTFSFDCPGCGTQVELRQRVTQSRRVCPGCGFWMSVEAIDRQLDRMEPDRQRILNMERAHLQSLNRMLFRIQFWSYSCLAIIVLFIFCIIIMAIFSSSR